MGHGCHDCGSPNSCDCEPEDFCKNCKAHRTRCRCNNLTNSRIKIGKLVKFWRSDAQGWVGLVLNTSGILQEVVLTGKGFMEGDIYAVGP